MSVSILIPATKLISVITLRAVLTVAALKASQVRTRMTVRTSMSALIFRIHPVTSMETVQTLSGLSLVLVNRDISVQDSTVLILMNALSFQEKLKNQQA